MPTIPTSYHPNNINNNNNYNNSNNTNNTNHPTASRSAPFAMLLFIAACLLLASLSSCRTHRETSHASEATGLSSVESFHSDTLSITATILRSLSIDCDSITITIPTPHHPNNTNTNNTNNTNIPTTQQPNIPTTQQPNIPTTITLHRPSIRAEEKKEAEIAYASADTVRSISASHSRGTATQTSRPAASGGSPLLVILALLAVLGALIFVATRK